MSAPESKQLALLFRNHRSELQAFAYRRLGDREAAADIVQDAFVRYATLAEEPDATARIEQPRFFLWRIVTNLMTDRERQLSRRGQHAAIDDLADTLPDPEASPERRLAAQQRLEHLRSALQELPENCRSALLMNRIEGLGHIEIAQRLGVSPSMVSKYIMQALRHCARVADPPAGAEE